MASTETFESTLKEVVRAKRLSASKVKELTEIAMKTMKSDTQLVSILYRTHKSLSPASKINSLYTFDALARAARSYANKHNQTGDLNTEPGNCATFLLRVEGVLDGLYKDMLTTNHPEAKEKTKKILDIWVKGHTFPSDVLSRLQKLVAEAEKVRPKERPSSSSTATADPRVHAAAPASAPPAAAPPSSTTPPTAPSPSTANPVQSQLLAMLTQVVAAAGTGQTVPNTAGPSATAGSAASPLDPKQMALFQQLAQVANAGNVPAAQPVPVPSLVPSAAPANAVPVAPPYGGPSQSHPYRDESNGFAAPRETQYDNTYPNGPPQQQRGRDFYDQRRDPRGDPRGPPKDGYPRGDPRSDPTRGDFRGGPRGGFRGRGRGRGGDRDPHPNRRWDAPPQGRNPQSRSRSPVARNGHRPHSPPHDRARSPLRLPPNVPTAASTAGKDEFGRDIRPPSPDAPPAPAPAAPHAPALSPHAAPAPIPTLSTDPEPAGAPIPTFEPAGAPIPTFDTAAPPAVGGIDTFDWSTFDMAAPASWDALGKAWNISRGYLPSQEELWQYVQMLTANMNGGAAYPMGPQYGMQQGAQWGMQEQGWGHNEGWRGRGRGRGRGGYGDAYGHGGGYGYGNGRGRGRGFDQNTDALTLVGGDDNTPTFSMPQADQAWQDTAPFYNQEPPAADGGNAGGGKGGRMQKVGDRWVFVKADA